MNILDVIEKKRDGKELTKDEIEFFISSYTNGETTDYQAAALVMAIFINGMTEEEIFNLTMAMAHSGDILDLSDISDNIVDKHSTGGVGDKVTLIVMPIIASLGVKVAKMSGRGLGITGGTADKLESIPGYNINLSLEQFKENVKNIGISLIGTTQNLAPADKKLYALRDTISCTNSIPLIVSSIMSKKIAAGANSIVLDVTFGSGSFMRDLERAKILSELMIKVGKKAGKNVRCVITDMDEPLGKFVGNSLEVKETVEFLRGNMCSDVKEVVYEIAIQILLLSKIFDSREVAKQKIDESISSGAALEKFRQLVMAQDGDVSYIDDLDKFEKALIITPIVSEHDGYIEKIDAGIIGKAAGELGAGRMRKEDPIDYKVGLEFNKKIGDYVSNGEIIGYIYSSDAEKAVLCLEKVKSAYTFGNKIINKRSIIEVLD